MQAEFKPPRQFAELHIKHIATLQKPTDILSPVLDKPLGCHPFDQIFRGARNVLLVMPDPSQQSGAEHYLPLLRERLHRLHVPDEETTILVAHTAEASAPHPVEKREFAECGRDGLRIFWHDPKDHKSHEYVGTTKRGTPIFINRLLLDADHVIIGGAVTHHPLAGYGGGPRLIVPGCAGQETRGRLQLLALDAEMHLQPQCRDAVIEANPLQEDAREAFRFITTNFILHSVLNDRDQVIGAVAGEPLQAYAAGCRAIDNIFRTPIDHLANLIIVSGGGFPNDIDYRTAHTALHRATQAARPGSVIIFLAECQRGLGSAELASWLDGAGIRTNGFGNSLAQQNSLAAEPVDWRRLHNHILHENETDGLIALSTLQKARTYHIIAVTGLEPAVVRQMGFTPAESFRDAIELARSWLPDIFSAYVIPNGNLLVPYLA